MEGCSRETHLVTPMNLLVMGSSMVDLCSSAPQQGDLLNLLGFLSLRGLTAMSLPIECTLGSVAAQIFYLEPEESALESSSSLLSHNTHKNIQSMFLETLLRFLSDSRRAQQRLFNYKVPILGAMQLVGFKLQAVICATSGFAFLLFG